MGFTIPTSTSEQGAGDKLTEQGVMTPCSNGKKKGIHQNSLWAQKFNDSVIENIWNVKTNGQLALVCASDFIYTTKAPAGSYGARFRGHRGGHFSGARGGLHGGTRGGFRGGMHGGFRGGSGGARAGHR